MPAYSVKAGEPRGEVERSAESCFGRELGSETPNVGANLEAVGADQLRQRAVDGVRTLPPNRSRAPAADAFDSLVEGEGRKDIGAARSEGARVRLAEAERLQSGGEWLAVARVLPRRPSVAQREHRRVVDDVGAVGDQHVRAAAQRTEPLILI